MQAIQTEYNGYKFRSRLEAKWAVFLDSIHQEYQYELEGFILNDGKYYLPDFHIEDIGVFLFGISEYVYCGKHKFFIEVKPTPNMAFDAKQMLYGNFEYPIIITSGDPTGLLCVLNKNGYPMGGHFARDYNGDNCILLMFRMDEENTEKAKEIYDYSIHFISELGDERIKSRQARFEHRERP